MTFPADAKKKDSNEEKKLEQLQTLGERPRGALARYVQL
jgi:hypothetical protein